MKKPAYEITIIEKDGTIKTMIATSRAKALNETYAAQKARKCKAWRITFTQTFKII